MASSSRPRSLKTSWSIAARPGRSGWLRPGLADVPDRTAKSRAEADAKLVREAAPDLDQVRSLDLARSASREVLRSYPIAPVTFFGIAKKDLEFGGYSIRAG